MDSFLSPLLLELQAFGEPAPSPAFSGTPACSRSRRVTGTFASSPPPHPTRSPQPTAAQGGKEEGLVGGGGVQPGQPSRRIGLPLAGDCSQMETVKPCRPQIHTERYVRIPGMCNCPASPSAALDSITCQVPSISPRAKTLSPTPSLCIWNAYSLWLSKYLSWAKGEMYVIGLITLSCRS